MKKDSTTKYYTVYESETDEIVAFGSYKECCKMLGMSEATFHSTVSRVVNGENKKYAVVVEERTPTYKVMDLYNGITVCGTRKECCKALGISGNRFQQILAKSRKGRGDKYVVEKGEDIWTVK